MTVRPFALSDAVAVVDLWTRCELLRPWNNPTLDIQRKLTRDPEGFLVGEQDGRIVGSIMIGYDGHRGWINYLAVDPALQGEGLGRQLMNTAEGRLLALGCPKVNLQIRTTNEGVLAFYRRLGYSPDDVVSLGKRLISDD